MIRRRGAAGRGDRQLRAVLSGERLANSLRAQLLFGRFGHRAASASRGADFFSCLRGVAKPLDFGADLRLRFRGKLFAAASRAGRLSHMARALAPPQGSRRFLHTFRAAAFPFLGGRHFPSGLRGEPESDKPLAPGRGVGKICPALLKASDPPALRGGPTPRLRSALNNAQNRRPIKAHERINPSRFVSRFATCAQDVSGQSFAGRERPADVTNGGTVRIRKGIN